MSFTIAVAGATGYAGGEILRLLSQHPHVLSGELVVGSLTGNANAGQRVGDVMPHLVPFADRVIEPTTVEILANHDIVFFALPHGLSASLAKQLPATTLLIDCAADFRLESAREWKHFYGSEHAGTWPYGLPEMPGARELLRATKRIAVPGCFPTGATLAGIPALAAELIEPDVSIVSITGLSGAGKKASVGLLGAETIGSLRAYNTAGKHRHVPEIAQNLSKFASQAVKVSFNPVLAPITRGILTVLTAKLKKDCTTEQAQRIYTEFYGEERFVQVLAPHQQPETQHVIGSNLCQIQIEVDEASSKLVVTAAIDNLAKGTAGGAVQSMNVALGYDEAAGLPTIGLAP